MKIKGQKGQHGGRRPGAGRKKGTKLPHTLEKEAAREFLRQMVKAELRPMVEAQIANAKGFKYLVVRQKHGGKFLRVTEAMARVKLGNDEEIVEVWEKDPNVHAFQDLLDRTLDKPSQHVSMDATVTVDSVERLDAARKRLNEARKHG